MAPASLARPSMGDPVSNPPAQPPNINFRHPGYKDGYNRLLILPTLDNGGIHYETALIACAILANNRWDGWFTEEQGGDRVHVPDDGILWEQNYYFRVSDHANGKYHDPLQYMLATELRRQVLTCRLSPRDIQLSKTSRQPRRL